MIEYWQKMYWKSPNLYNLHLHVVVLLKFSLLNDVKNIKISNNSEHAPWEKINVYTKAQINFKKIDWIVRYLACFFFS